MTVIINAEPTGTFTRYLMLYPDAPELANIHHLIENRDADELRWILIVTPDGETVPVTLEQEDDGTWLVCLSDGEIAEAIRYDSDDSDDVAYHAVFVDGFTTDDLAVLVHD